MRRKTQRGEAAASWARSEGMSELMHELLVRRGISSAEEAERFLHPAREQLHDPMLLSDMAEAVALIRTTRDEMRPVWVYGDYDVDGVSACAILSQALVLFGMDARTYIPSRHREGYGLNEAAVREIAREAGCPEKRALLVTVDCGISCAKEVALAKELGLDVIVTDHHRPGDLLPECPVVNPLLKGYPFGYLCGAGVAFKLSCALLGWETASRFLDLAALATVADIVPLVDENRVLVFLGLQAINEHPRPGLQALIHSAGLRGRTISAGNIGFQLGPRLNASGRLGDARRALRLLTGTETGELNRIAQELEDENTERKQVEKRIVEEAHALMTHYDLLEHKILLLKGEGWNSGVIGLAASRLVSEYHYPTILLSAENGVCTGSCRSIPAVDIYAALCTCADLMIRFGGHRQAAGLTIEEKHVPELIERLDAYLREHTRPEDYIPEAEYDLELPLTLLYDEEMQRAQADGLRELERDLREDMERAAHLALEHAVADEAFFAMLEDGEPRDTLPALREELTEKANRLIDRQDLYRARRKGVEAAERRAVESLSLLQPTGYGNLTPAFLCRARLDSARSAGSDGATLQASLSQAGCVRRAVGFGLGARAGELAGTEREIIYCPSINRWKDTVSLQYELRELLPEGFEEAAERFERKYQLAFNAYLRDMLYNNSLTGVEGIFAPAEPLPPDAPFSWLREDVQGTVIAAVTREGANELLSLLREQKLTDRADVLVGCWPKEQACFNSICLCPSGEAKFACRRLILWDAPRAAFAALPRAKAVCERPEQGCLWAKEIPDVARLRELFVALRRILTQRGASAADAIRALAQEARTSEVCVQCGVAVLCRVNLVTWTHAGGALQLLPTQKCDPASDPLFRRLTALREYALRKE